MPPKRKAISSDILIPRKTKIQRKKEATKQAQLAAEKMLEMRQKWFGKYADADNPEIISPDGCQAFFADLGVSLESIVPIIIGWKMEASRMGYITWDEWSKAMEALGVSDETDFKKKLKDWESSIIQDPEQFKRLYLFTFNYVKSTGQKSMDVETATALWPVMLQDKYPIINSFIRFLQEKKPVKVINKDQWSSLLDFCEAVPEDLQNYDSTSSWPVLFDDYVEWRQAV